MTACLCMVKVSDILLHNDLKSVNIINCNDLHEERDMGTIS